MGKNNNIKRRKKYILLNENIRFQNILVIGEDKKKIGEMSSKKALELSREKNLDLFCISRNSEIPVCEIGDFHKYQYDLKKNLRKNKKPTHKIKQIRMKGNIEENDILIKSKKAIKFLLDGNKVKISMVLYGRQFYQKKFFLPVILNFASKLKKYGIYNEKISQKGRFFNIIVTPIKNNMIK